MFWRCGTYPGVSTIDTLLDKPDVTVEELLEDSDLIQELRQYNSRLIEYLREDNVLKRLMDYVIAPSLVHEGDDYEANDTNDAQDITAKGEKQDPLRDLLDPDDLDRAEQNRLKHAYVASEVLSSDIWSILDSMMQNTAYLRDFWGFLRRPPPLDPIQASYFTKVNETLFSKKTEFMLEFIKSLDRIIPDMLRHIDNPMVMDLLLKIISLERAEGGQGIVDWLKSRDLIPILLSLLSPEQLGSVQTSAGEFIKAIITISANATLNDQSCIGPNSLTRQLVSEQCVNTLISFMLQGGNSLTVGVGIVIEVIRKNNSDYDPENVGGPGSIPTTYDPIYLGTLLRRFADHVPDFMALTRSPTHTIIEGGKVHRVERGQLNSPWGARIEPLGFDRFKTCELMAELLHCSNMGLLNESGSEEYVHRRDAERERLTAGLHAPKGDASNADYRITTADSGDGSTLDYGFSENFKTFDVSNAGEEDGFEDVSSSGVLVEGVKDVEEQGGRGEESKTDMSTTTASRTPETEIRGDPAQGPLPESKHDDDCKAEATGSRVQPQPSDVQSPTTSLIDQFEKIKLNDEDNTSENASGPQGTVGASPKEQDGSAARISSHPEDIPAPLFVAKQQVGPSASDASAPVGDASSPTSTGPQPPSTGFEPGSPMDELARQCIQIADDGQPVVGDYLKIMFVKNRVVPAILSFFFRFPWNNFLHNVVYDVVQQVFNGPMERGYNRVLAIDVFKTGRITEQIVEGQRRSDESQKSKHIRLGNMGHLTLIAEEVVKFSERHPPELLTKIVMDGVLNADWVQYVEQTLSETRERDNAILGGVRPEMSLRQRQAIVHATQGYGGSSALAEAGLNGDFGASNFQGFEMTDQGGVSGGAFNIGGGGNTLLSGPGNSSDDEEEEEEEEDEEVEGQDDKAQTENAAEGSSDNDSSNSSSQPIPILPPPPAPLTLGPSRARRQLAARLAQQKQKAAENSEGESGEKTQTSSQENSGDPWPSNPFVIAGLEDGANKGESSSTAAFPSTDFQSSNRDDIFSSSPFPDAGFSPPDSLSPNSSDGGGGEGPPESVRRTVRVPLEVEDDDDDDEMGEMVGPNLSVGSGMMDSDEEDEAIINESLGYSNPFSSSKYKSYHGSHASGTNPDYDEQNDSSDGEDDGLVEILVPGRKSSTSSR